MCYLPDCVELHLRDAKLLLRLRHARCPRLLSLLARVLETALALLRVRKRRGELGDACAQERRGERTLLELPLMLLGLPAQCEQLEGLIAPIIRERRAQGVQVCFLSSQLSLRGSQPRICRRDGQSHRLGLRGACTPEVGLCGLQ